MKIKKQDKLMVLSALLVGVISGSYLYLVGFAPEFQSGQGVATEEEVTDFLIVGEMYGGMRAGLPPSFQIEADGSYRYIPFSDNTELPSEALEGALPRALMSELREVLTDDVLIDAAEPETKEMCALMVDGIDYQYIVVRDGVEYELDTCTTRFTNETPAGEALLSVWEYFDEQTQ
ncbi:MAG: hypothetical protein MUF19_01570 [Candidatus Pacebacteria bacterium]|jgi:hypothetical protein|nr:hypothetical protein [Candidatus Paceibacterota bacterium]